MASSNRHWPSMFKSKPCNHHHHHHQWAQHDVNSSLMVASTGNCHRSPYSSVSGVEERSPEPKPRWNPKPEQIQILEAIFNSGMVNPPRDEIRKIRAQLQEFGQVGDANVFYWFQNRKSRSKHKLRHLQNSTKYHPHPQTQTSQTQTQTQTQQTCPSNSAAAPVTLSLSEKSPQKGVNKSFTLDSVNYHHQNQTAYNNFHPQSQNGQFLAESFFFPVQQQLPTGSSSVQGFNFTEPITGLPLNETNGKRSELYEEKNFMMKQPAIINNNNNNNSHVMMMTSAVLAPNHSIGAAVTTSVTVPSTNFQIQVASAVEHDTMGYCGGRSTVIINDVLFEVTSGPFNVKDAFGEDAVLIHSSGQPVLTNEWGLTLHPLQHSSFYYLI